MEKYFLKTHTIVICQFDLLLKCFSNISISQKGGTGKYKKYTLKKGNAELKKTSQGQC